MKAHHKTFAKFVLFSCLVGLIYALMPSIHAKAASARIGFSIQEPEITTGDVVSIILTIDADATIGDFEGYVSYDPEALEFISGATCIAGGDGTLKISDIYASSTTGTRKYIMKFQALKPGGSELTVSGQPQVFEYETGLAMSASSTSLDIMINAAAEASTNSQLASLKVSPGTLTPTFSGTVYEYTVDVDGNTNELLVSAIAEDITASVTISDNKELEAGTNTVHVYVTSEAGTVSEYLIYVYKEESTEATQTPAEVTEEPVITKEPDAVEEQMIPGTLQIAEDNENLIISGGFSYTVMNEPGNLTVPDGFQKTKVIISGIQITAYAPFSNGSSDFLLLILKKEEGDPAFYRYDRVEKTIQRFQSEDITLHLESSEGETLTDIVDAQAYDQNVTKLGFIIAALAAASVLLLIGLIHFYMKAKGLREDDLE